jgi:hypothetical protein
MKKDKFINILRHISPDNRFLYNIKYYDNGNIDTLGIHLLGSDNRWSPPLPLCTFNEEEIDEIKEMCEALIARFIP